MEPPSDLVAHVVATTALTPAEAQRVVGDVVAYYAESAEQFVRRRHSELKTYGTRNPEAFARIARELSERVVAPTDLSERQIRRIVYG